MFIIENESLTEEQLAHLNMALDGLNGELQNMVEEAGEAQRKVKSLDEQFTGKIKELFDRAAESLEYAGLSEHADAVRDELRDQTHDVMYDWTSGRPMEFDVEDDGTVGLWEPSTC